LIQLIQDTVRNGGSVFHGPDRVIDKLEQFELQDKKNA